MALCPITINTPKEQEPHLFAQDDASIYQSIFGEDCVFDIGSKFKTQTLSNNKIRLSDGILQNGGHIARIKHGDYEDVTITNGVSGKKRVTIIGCRFSTTGSVDNMILFTKDGVAGSTYTDPALTQNDLYAGGTTREMPLCGGVKKDITISSYNIDMTKPYTLNISPEYGQGHPAVSIFKQSDSIIRVLTKQKVSGLLLNWSVEGTKKVK